MTTCRQCGHNWTDLVGAIRSLYVGSFQGHEGCASLALRAADEIERLEAECARWHERWAAADEARKANEQIAANDALLKRWMPRPGVGMWFFDPGLGYVDNLTGIRYATLEEVLAVQAKNPAWGKPT